MLAAVDQFDRDEAALTAFDEAARTLTSFGAGSDPRAIVARVFAQPFAVPGETPQSFDINALVTKSKKGGGMSIELPDGVGVANRVTAEQLLAIIAAIIATSPDATKAVQRIRAEVLTWAFQGHDGVIR